MKYFLVIILLSTCYIEIYSQNNKSERFVDESEIVVKLDTLSPTPSELYYKNAISLKHDYNYEKSNRLKSLKLKKAELQAATGLICLASMFGISFLLADYENDLSLLWAIPTGMAVAAGECVLLSKYIKNIQKEIDIIQSFSIYSYSINKRLEVDAVHFYNKNDIAQHSYGVSLKFKL